MSRELHSMEEIAATTAEVFALRTSPRWVELKAERLADGSTLVDRTVDETGAVTLVVSRNLPAGAPGFLQRFLPRDGKVVQRETWSPPAEDGSCAGTWSVEVPGAPARLGGESLLESSGSGTRQTISGTASISIPLVGGKAEQFVVEMSTKLIAKEAVVMREALAS